VPEATAGAAGMPVSASTRDWQGFKLPLLPCRPPRSQKLQPPQHPGGGKQKVSPSGPPAAAAGGPLVGFFYLAANAATLGLALRNSPAALRALLAESTCQLVEAKYGAKLRRDQWRVMVRCPRHSFRRCRVKSRSPPQLFPSTCSSLHVPAIAARLSHPHVACTCVHAFVLRPTATCFPSRS
jgi:hypothetical protein